MENQQIISFYSLVLAALSDGRCGQNFSVPYINRNESESSQTVPAQCDPFSAFPCCSAHGYCGGDSSHCSCADGGCVDYRLQLQQEEEETANITSRPDGRCGPKFGFARCEDESVLYPCCSFHGFCGVGWEYCECVGCIDYRIKTTKSASLDLPAHCGQSGLSVHSKIVGGAVALRNAWPWQALIKLRPRRKKVEGEGGGGGEGGAAHAKEQYCGGTIIGRRHVITAAHCVINRRPADVSVLLGRHEFAGEADEAAGERRLGARRIVAHPRYAERSNNFDFAVVMLEDEVTYSEQVSPVCLPRKIDIDMKLDYSGYNAMVTGWGHQTSGAGHPSPQLMQAQVQVLGNDNCGQYSPWLIKEEMLCAAGTNTDSCQGDSGGPLVIRRSDARWELIGLVSWGYGCSMKGYPGVYARVTSVLDWIQGNLQL